MNDWSTNFQNPDFMKKSGMMIINRDMAAYTVDKLGLKSGMRVLDVGCGTGEFTYYLAGQCSALIYFGNSFPGWLVTVSVDNDMKKE